MIDYLETTHAFGHPFQISNAEPADSDFFWSSKYAKWEFT